MFRLGEVVSAPELRRLISLRRLIGRQKIGETDKEREAEYEHDCYVVPYCPDAAANGQLREALCAFIALLCVP